jgi:hypothetical protein
MQKKEKTVIGWSEYIGFPEWGINRIHAKVDTGARTSALHVEEIKHLPNGYIEFEVIVDNDRPHKNVTVMAKLIKTARVRSSTGVYTKRCFVKTKVVIGPVEKEIEISLVSREKMVFRMLLGRKALEKDFLVDVSLRDHLAHPKKVKQRKS